MTPAQARLARHLILGLAISGLLHAVPAWAQQAQAPMREVTVQNETDMPIQELYLGAPGAQDRGPDRLGGEAVAMGTGRRIRLGRIRDCVFDVTVTYDGGREEQRPRVDLCRNQRLVFGDPSLPTRQVAVTNGSRVALRELYAARGRTSEAEGWGPDRLGDSVIDPGGRFTLRLRARECGFDLRAVYGDNREEVRRDLDLCRLGAVTFDRSGVPPLPVRGVVLANRHVAAVQEVYLSASTDADWGPDRLGDVALHVGDDASVQMEGGCEADLRIVFPNGGAEERRGVDLCETTRIVLRPGWVVAERLDEEGPVAPEPVPQASAGVLRLRNAGRLPIIEVYTGRPGGPRGEDRLGADTLPVGSLIELEPPDPDACAADLVAVFRNGREVTRPDIDLCSGEEIELR